MTADAVHDEQSLGKAYDARLLLRLWPFLRPYKWIFALDLLVFAPLFVLELAPDDHAVVLEGGAPAIARIAEQQGVRIEANEEIELGQARVRGGESHVELDLDQALERIRQELLTLTSTRDADEAGTHDADEELQSPTNALGADEELA